MTVVAPTVVLDLAAAEERCGQSPLEWVRAALAALPVGHVLEVRSAVADQVFTVRAWSRGHVTILDDHSDGLITTFVLAPP